MAPVMSHEASRIRAEEALAWRAQAYTWAEISAKLGFKQRDGARLAVKRLLASTRRPTVAELRGEHREALRVQRRRLFDQQAVAERGGDIETVTRVAREIRANLEAASRLDGLNMPQSSVVDVRISTVEDTRRRLLAIVAQPTPALPVVDVEAVEVTA